MTTRREVDGPLSALVVSPDAHPTREPVLLVHGFTQAGRSWRPLAERLAQRGHVAILPDLPGHGRSAAAHATLEETADLLAEFLATTVTGPVAAVGYSLGGRCALHLATRHPATLTRLVLIGAHPGLLDANERAVRRLDDDALAARLEVEGVEAFLDHWLTVPLFGGFIPDETEQSIRRSNTVVGLAASLRGSGTGAQEPLWDRLATVSIPVLAMAGSRDTKFVALAQRLAATMPHARSLIIEGAAHMAHLEQPHVVASAIESFLDDDGSTAPDSPPPA